MEQDDRLEITSPGMLIGGLSIEDIKQGCSKPRNRGLVNAFAYMRIIEQWGSGIPRVIQACKDVGLPEPELTEIGGNFRVIIFRESIMHPQATPQDKCTILLEFCSIPRTREEIMHTLELSDRKSFRKTYIEPLIASGLLVMTQPGRPKSPTQRYKSVRTNR